MVMDHTQCCSSRPSEAFRVASRCKRNTSVAREAVSPLLGMTRGGTANLDLTIANIYLSRILFFYEKDAHDAVGVMQKLGYSEFSVLGWCDGGVCAIIAAARYIPPAC